MSIKNKNMWGARGGIALRIIALLLAASPCICSAQTADRTALMQLLEALRANGTIDQSTFAAIVRTAGARANDTRQKTADRGRAERELPDVHTGTRFEVIAPGGDFRFRIGGRIQVDAAAYDGDRADLGDGTRVRRARLFAQGVLARDWAYKLQYDFTASGAGGINDAFIAYTGLGPWSVKVGHFKEPFSLENMTSSKYVTFIERALPEVFRPARSIGVAAATHGTDWSAAAGVFGEGVGTSPAGADENDEGYAGTARFTWAPLPEPQRLLHLGVAGSYRAVDQTDSLRLRQRPESNITNVRLVDTGTFDADAFVLLGLEAAVQLGPVHLQSEYMRMEVDRALAGNADVDVDGFYGEAGIFLTGESRNYSPTAGKFGRIDPLRPLAHGGFGAWQVAARFSSLDLSDGDVDGGEQRDVTVGVNWWPITNLRFSVSYTKVLDADGGPNPHDEPSIFSLRSQVEF